VLADSSNLTRPDLTVPRTTGRSQWGPLRKEKQKEQKKNKKKRKRRKEKKKREKRDKESS